MEEPEEFNPFDGLQEALLEPDNGKDGAVLRPTAEDMFRPAPGVRQAAAGSGSLFTAVDAGDDDEKPFVLIPAGIHTIIPAWVWAAIAVLLLGMGVMIVMIPGVKLNQLTARLGDPDPGVSQASMRQMILNANEAIVNMLFDQAADGERKIADRLRAIDTLGLIDRPDAERALQRLELGTGTDERVRDAAVAARRQREAARSRGNRR